MMKAITIHQPWATLIAIGAKRFETRSWATKHRGRQAIHAGKLVDKEACEREPIKSVLAEHGYTVDNLPTGAVLATAYLYDSYPITHVYDNVADSIDEKGTILEIFEGNEFHFGFYEVGSYAWELRDAYEIDPIPAKGQQGLWNWEGL